MVSLKLVGTEVSALGAAALSMPLRLVLRRAHFDPAVPHPTPVVLVHGFFGDPTNFLSLRSHFATRGIHNFATFAYPPRIDYQRLALRLGRAIDAFCTETGAAEVDLVGHSLGGLISRYLVEMSPHVPVRCLATLGAPYFASPMPQHELAIFGEHDLFIPPPHPLYRPHGWRNNHPGRTLIVPDCGHWGLLYNETVRHEVAEFLISDRGRAVLPGPAPVAALEAS
jgi:pimeloyl-ACP methyl ester carboxylesterase